jgi:hypothetical protein
MLHVLPLLFTEINLQAPDVSPSSLLGAFRNLSIADAMFSSFFLKPKPTGTGVMSFVLQHPKRRFGPSMSCVSCASRQIYKQIVLYAFASG